MKADREAKQSDLGGGSETDDRLHVFRAHVESLGVEPARSTDTTPLLRLTPYSYAYRWVVRIRARAFQIRDVFTARAHVENFQTVYRMEASAPLSEVEAEALWRARHPGTKWSYQDTLRDWPHEVYEPYVASIQETPE